MKGVILAGGLATRLRPLTLVTNKHLLPIYNKPMIYYPVEAMAKAGVEEVLITSSPDHSEEIEKLLQSGHEFGLKLMYAVQENPKGGISDAIMLAEEFAKGENLLVILGDNIFNFDLDKARQKFEDASQGAMVFGVKMPTESGQYGVIEVDNDGNVLSIEEKPEHPKSDIAQTGIYMYDSGVFDKIKNLSPSARGELEVTDLNNLYVKDGGVKCELIDWWIDAGTSYDELLRANNMVAEKSKKRRIVTMKLLVTGGAGFIGSNFILYWLENHPADEIVNFDKLTYAGNLENLKSIEKNPNYKFVKGDICNAVEVDAAMSEIDIVVHFAAESHVDRSIMEPAEFALTNVIGTQVLLDSALKHKVSRFHHVSTDEVFGALRLESQEKFDENTRYDPHSPYSASKAGSDHLVRAYSDTFGLPISITNCSNNFGPYQFPEKIIPLAITNVMTGAKIPIYGDGLYVRDWLYVEDHCRAIDVVLSKGKVGETYCVGGMSNDVNNLELAKKILNLLGGSEDVIEFIKDRPGHDRRYAVDWSKIKNELGWEPKHSFDEWLEKTVQWYKDNESWWKEVKNGEYQKYYDLQYNG